MREKRVFSGIFVAPTGPATLLCTTFHAQTRVTLGGARISRLSRVCSTGHPTNNGRVPFSTSSPSLPAEAAITAFLHGIERRAWVFARAQCGDEVLAGQAVASAVDEFRRGCAGKPLASWPRDFWTLLLAQPLLLRGESLLLPELSVGPRAALLLRLVAGLDMLHAAQVLGVSEAAYRAALSHALQQMQAAGDDPANLEALRERLQQEIRQAPSVSRMHASEPAEPTVAGAIDSAPMVFASDDGEQRLTSAPWRLVLKILLGLLLLALITSFFWTPWRGLAPGESEPLPPEAISALAPADASAAVTHPDFALLVAPEDEALARDLAFYSWLAAGAQADAAADNAPAAGSSLGNAAPASPVTTSKGAR
jgi:DNA-directed RNA polymerase specialized sigma24 family protein